MPSVGVQTKDASKMRRRCWGINEKKCRNRVYITYRTAHSLPVCISFFYSMLFLQADRQLNVFARKNIPDMVWCQTVRIFFASASTHTVQQEDPSSQIMCRLYIYTSRHRMLVDCIHNATVGRIIVCLRDTFFASMSLYTLGMPFRAPFPDVCPAIQTGMRAPSEISFVFFEIIFRNLLLKV